MLESKRPFEKYLREYVKCLSEVIDETYSYSEKSVKMLLGLIDDWIDLVPKEKNHFFEATNSLSGVILLNSWKLVNWISFEILCGKYFEALRNLRFIFEGCVHAVVIEDIIESQIWERWQSLSSITLKAEIFKLWEICKSEKVYDYKKRKVRKRKVKEIVKNFVEDLGFSSEEKREHIEVYTKILSQQGLYIPTGAMIQRCCELLRIEEEKENLKQLWHELSRYQHFSYPYLEVACEKPEYIFLEMFDKEMFELSLELYFKTMDFLYAVIAWRFPQLRKRVKEVCKWWNNFGKPFHLAEKVIKKVMS